MRPVSERVCAAHDCKCLVKLRCPREAFRASPSQCASAWACAMREHPLRVLQYEYSLEGTMRQTVVGVFETSDEARRAQAALLDAQFQPASIRVSAGGTPRGAD